MNITAIVTWVGIAASTAGIYSGVYVPIQSKLEATRQEEVKQSAQRQKTLDQINDRFDNLEMVVNVLAQETPKNTRMILNQIRQSRKESQRIVMFEKSVPVDQIPADAPQVEEPK